MLVVLVVSEVLLGVLPVAVFFAVLAVILRERAADRSGSRRPRWWLVLVSFVVLATDLPLFVLITRLGVRSAVLGAVVALFGVLLLVLELRGPRRVRRPRVLVLIGVLIVLGLVAAIEGGVTAATFHCVHCYALLPGASE